MTACASRCTLRGEHLPDCDGEDLVRGEVVDCRGCQPRPAEVGVLCSWCWGRLQSLVRTLPSLIDHLMDAAVPALASPMGRASDGGSGTSRPGEGMLYPHALAEADDLHALLATWTTEVASERGLTSMPATGTRWSEPDSEGAREPLGLATPEGTRALVAWLDPHLDWCAHQGWAGDLVSDLATASGRALARFPMEERERRAEVPCPACGCLSLTVSPPTVAGASVTVSCRLAACGLTMSEEDWGLARARAVAVARVEAEAEGAR